MLQVQVVLAHRESLLATRSIARLAASPRPFAGKIRKVVALSIRSSKSMSSSRWMTTTSMKIPTACSSQSVIAPRLMLLARWQMLDFMTNKRLLQGKEASTGSQVSQSSKALAVALKLALVGVRRASKILYCRAPSSTDRVPT